MVSSDLGQFSPSQFGTIFFSFWSIWTSSHVSLDLLKERFKLASLSCVEVRTDQGLSGVKVRIDQGPSAVKVQIDQSFNLN